MLIYQIEFCIVSRFGEFYCKYCSKTNAHICLPQLSSLCSVMSSVTFGRNNVWLFFMWVKESKYFIRNVIIVYNHAKQSYL